MKQKLVSLFCLLLLIFNISLLHTVVANAAVSYRKPFIQNYSTTLASYPTKEIVVSLSQEELTAYDGSAIFLQTPVTTGGPSTPTPAGTYHVLGKYQNFVMHSPWPPSDWRWYPDSFVNYGLLFQSDGYYIHDASWRNNFGPGSNSLAGTPGGDYTGTHGCVNVPYSAEVSLYNWATVGTTVVIQ